MPDTPANRFAIPVEELERASHVPLAEQVASQPEPPTPDPMSPEDLDRIRLLSIAASGRLTPS